MAAFLIWSVNVSQQDRPGPKTSHIPSLPVIELLLLCLYVAIICDVVYALIVKCIKPNPGTLPVHAPGLPSNQGKPSSCSLPAQTRQDCHKRRRVHV